MHAEAMKTLHGADIRLGHGLLDDQTVGEDRRAVRANLDRALQGARVVEEAFSGEDERTPRRFSVTHDPSRDDDGIIGVAVRELDVAERCAHRDRMVAVPRGDDDRPRPGDAVRLRRRATQGPDGLSAASPPQIEDTAAVHGLRVHQIELESRNEELHRARLEPEASREKCLDLFDLAPGGCLAVNEKSIVTDANLTAARLLGVERQQLVGLPFTAFITAPYQDAYYRHHRLLEQTGEPQACELSLRRGVGEAGVRMTPSHFWVRLEGRPQRDADGEMLCGWVMFTDIDAQMRAAEEIRGPFQAIIDANHEQAFALDVEGRYIAFNRAHAAAVRALYGVEIAIGERQTDYAIEEADREAARADHERALAGESFVVDPVLGGAASQRRFEIVHTPQTDAAGTVVGVVVRANEITEREQAEAALRESEAMRTAAERVARVGSWRWEPSTQRVSWSPEMYRLYDVDPGGFHGDFAPVLNSRVHPDDREAAEKAVAAVAETGEPIPAEYRVVHRDGTEHILYGEGVVERDEAGDVVSIAGYYQDVTEQRRLEAALREREVKYRTVADYTYDWEWWAAPNGTYAYVSPACERITGHSAEEFLANPDLLLAITHPDDVATVREHLQADKAHGAADDRLEFRIFAAAGDERVIEHRCQEVVDEDGAHLGRRGSNRDITERRLAEEEIRRQNRDLLLLNDEQARLNDELVEERATLKETNESVAHIAATDDLTGVANRRSFRESMQKAVSMARRHGAPLALVSFDLDGLKRVNDSAGHAAGDEVLVLFAEHLGSVCRVEDLPARLGGDEFSLLLPGIDVNGARGLAERVLAGVRSCAVLQRRGVTVSAGVAGWKTEDLPEDLLRRADEALYAAKRGGGNTVAGDA